MTITELKQKRAALIDDAKAVERAAQISNRELTDEELASIETLLGQADGVKEQIDGLERKSGLLSKLKETSQNLDKTGTAQTVVRNAPAGSLSPIQVRARLQEDPKRGFQDERDFYLAVLQAGMNPGAPLPENLAYQRVKNPRIGATAGSDEQGIYSDPYGGFLVPKAFSPQFLQRPTETDPVAGRTTSVPMGSPKLDIPARVDTTHTTSVSGGLRVYRRAEALEITASRMEMALVALHATSLAGLTYVTEELLKYSPQSVASLLSAGFVQEFQSRIARERIRGTGVGEYLGIINSPCLVTVSKEVGQSADTILGENIVNMRKRCWMYSDAIWLANHDTYAQLASAHIPGTNSDVYLFNPSRGEDVPDTLLGQPIFFVEDASTLGDVGDIILGNWSQYLEGTLEEMETAESIHVRFVNNERAFRFTMSNAGTPWWAAALTPKNSTSTLSPFVVLEAR